MRPQASPSGPDIAIRLRTFRTANNLSRADLASIADVSKRTIRRVESGEGTPSASSAIKLAAALGCEVADLWPELGVGER
jgi:putative molybdopterin biosynthesis protein